MRRRGKWIVALSVAGALPLLGFMPVAPHWTLIGWNNLGMHCDDSDFSVFSILPPYNVVNAQLIDNNGVLVTDPTGFTVTYEAVADPTGSINKSSAGKTNFWTFAPALFAGASSVPDKGLAGFDMPGAANTPKAMVFDANYSWFHAEGIPITPYDDAMHKRTYPLMKLVARDAAGNVLATTTPVLPVSDEMDCAACHSSNSAPDAMPDAGWVHDRNEIRDYRLNIVRLHDDRFLGNAKFDAALVTAGYSSNGLEDTVRSMNTPILCARCHASNALPGTGIAGIPQLTTSVHSFHGHVNDPLTGLSLDDSTNRQSCYRCHPGSSTRCLRGVMGASVAPDGSLAIQCQNCHGNMSSVGDSARTGWLEQPNCQACHTGTATHNNGAIRYTDVFDGASMRIAVDATFATNPDTPAAGFSLYRFSSGHGGLQCEACHGSTHAEFPAAHPNDNLQSSQLQGHVGTMVECTACHATTPSTDNGGPHGMHPVGQTWVGRHQDARDRQGLAECRMCHGADDRGTVLSRVSADRTLDIGDGGSLTVFRGQIIGCYTCHNGPGGDDGNGNHAPTASDNSATAIDQPVTIALGASDSDGDPLTLRIVEQPHFGRVALTGTSSSYIPDPGFAGVDAFTFAAFDGSIDSNLATVRVTRGATWANYGSGFPGTANAIPTLTLDRNPQLGSHVTLTLGNTSGSANFALLVVSPEQAGLTTPFGGLLVTELSTLVMTVVPAGGAAFTGGVPSDPAFIGVSEFLQSLQVDPGAYFGVAFSYGLRMTIGQ